jgi:predicted Zn-dependent protease
LSQAQDGPAAALVRLLDTELQRNFVVLKTRSDPPVYYIAYTVTEEEGGAMSATLGALVTDQRSQRRMAECSLRAGTPALDNHHVLDGNREVATASTMLPAGNDDLAISMALWRITDIAQRAAVQRYAQIQAALKTKAAPAQASADFSAEPPHVATLAVPAPSFPADLWRARLRRISALVGSTPAAITSNVALSWRREVRTLVTSEGTRIQQGRTYASLSIQAWGKAMDGEDLFAVANFDAETLAHLPKEQDLLEAARQVGATLDRLRLAPQADPYVGPAILSGRAAGVLFHEIFGHRIEGHRQADTREGQTFTHSLGQMVLPEFLSVISDPTRHAAGGVELNGWYDYDDEGVPAQRVTLVDNGRLRAFLMSRTPAPGAGASNGHGRKQPGYEVVSRQSNLFVVPARSLSAAELRNALLNEARRQGKPYGLLFDTVTGGFTQTRRESLQSYSVVPLVVYRVYVDGRPDELVRGVDIVGTPLASFARILAAGNEPGVFNGYCGAESGQVPVAAVSPALLIGEIEIQRKRNNGDRPPLLQRPREGDRP